MTSNDVLVFVLAFAMLYLWYRLVDALVGYLVARADEVAAAVVPADVPLAPPQTYSEETEWVFDGAVLCSVQEHFDRRDKGRRH